MSNEEVQFPPVAYHFDDIGRHGTVSVIVIATCEDPVSPSGASRVFPATSVICVDPLTSFAANGRGGKWPTVDWTIVHLCDRNDIVIRKPFAHVVKALYGIDI
jgi:hypothetical protein